MKREALLKRGFVDTAFKYDGEHFTEFKLIKNGYTIEISGEVFVELMENTSSYYITVPNCKTITQLDKLMSVFNMR